MAMKSTRYIDIRIQTMTRSTHNGFVPHSIVQPASRSHQPVGGKRLCTMPSGGLDPAEVILGALVAGDEVERASTNEGDKRNRKFYSPDERYFTGAYVII